MDRDRTEMSERCIVAPLGVVGVDNAERFMAGAVDLRIRKAIPDLLLVLAHPRTVALGLRDRLTEHPKDLLVPVTRLQEEGIGLTRSVRGGGITYHWPGQVVCYPVLALRPTERNVGAYMRNLEEVGIRTLGAFGIEATRVRDSAAHLGLWCQRRKVVSMGVRITHWVTSFGFAVNVEGDHGPSAYVRPCGLKGVRLTTFEEILGKAPPRAWVLEALKEHFGTVVGRTLEKMPAGLVNEIWSRAHATEKKNIPSGWRT